MNLGPELLGFWEISLIDTFGIGFAAPTIHQGLVEGIPIPSEQITKVKVDQNFFEGGGAGCPGSLRVQRGDHPPPNLTGGRWVWYAKYKYAGESILMQWL